MLNALHGKYWNTWNGNEIYKAAVGRSQRMTERDFGYTE